MNIHDKMVNELFDNKSLKALEYLIDQGRELQFKYNDITCFISKDNSKSYVSAWVEKDEKAFGSIQDLIENMKIGNIPFEVIWRESELNVLF